VKLLKKLWAWLTGKHASSGSTNEAFNVGKAEAPSSWIPFQQDDRPRH
jgi:hypothetical protein